MPSDQCDLTMVKAMGLIFSLFDSFSLRVPFGEPKVHFIVVTWAYISGKS